MSVVADWLLGALWSGAATRVVRGNRTEEFFLAGGSFLTELLYNYLGCNHLSTMPFATMAQS